MDRGLTPHTRHVLFRTAFVLLVIVIPIWFGFSWSDHQRTQDIASIVQERRQLLIESCQRGNIIRVEHNALVQRVSAISEIMADYLVLDASTKNPALTQAEIATVIRLRSELARNSKAPVLPIVDCERTIK